MTFCHHIVDVMCANCRPSVSDLNATYKPGLYGRSFASPTGAELRAMTDEELVDYAAEIARHGKAALGASIEAERDLWWAERFAAAFRSDVAGQRAFREMSQRANEALAEREAEK